MDALPLDLLPAAALGFVLVLVRVSAAVMLLPVLGEMELPAMLRVGTSLALTVLIAPAQLAHAPDPSEPPVLLALQLARELATGLFIGFAARIIALALPMAAELIALFTGLASIVQPDPQLGPQSTGLARMFSLATPALLLVSGLYQLPVFAVADSYRLVPLGGGMPSGDVLTLVSALVGRSFASAFELAAPFVIAGTLWHVCLGLVGRFVPAFQVGSIAAPGQLLGGLILIACLSTLVLAEWRVETAAMLTDLEALMHG